MGSLIWVSLIMIQVALFNLQILFTASLNAFSNLRGSPKLGQSSSRRQTSLRMAANYINSALPDPELPISTELLPSLKNILDTLNRSFNPDGMSTMKCSS